jgi:hypothetical protein
VTPDKVGKLECEPAILLKDELASALAKVKAETGNTIQVPGSQNQCNCERSIKTRNR